MGGEQRTAPVIGSEGLVTVSDAQVLAQFEKGAHASLIGKTQRSTQRRRKSGREDESQIDKIRLFYDTILKRPHGLVDDCQD